MTEPAEISERYRRFADAECRGYSEIYYRLALAVAADDAVLRFVAERPMSQPNLFFAAIQYLTGPDDMPTTGAALRQVLSRRGREVAEIMRTRRTQTNEVGRCAVLLPAMPRGPLALIEVGASAGLCLLLDQYLYDYGSARTGLASSSVRLECAVTGAAPLPAACPKIVWRRGLDIAPVDVRDDDAVRWLLACVWSDHGARRQRLQAAIDVARASPPPVVAGDLIDDLRAVAADAPPDATLVVFHSAVLSYVTRDRRELFAASLAELSRHREVVWISNEAAGVVARFVAHSPTMLGLHFVVGRTIFRAGAIFREGAGRDDVLAFAHPHGLAMTWL